MQAAESDNRIKLGTNRRDNTRKKGNARVGYVTEDLEHIMESHGVWTMNENGSLLVELCGNHSVKIGGTLLPHKKGFNPRLMISQPFVGHEF